MKTSEFQKLIGLANIDGQIVAIENHEEIRDDTVEGEVIYVKLVNARDLKMHKAYFGLLKFIYDYLPSNFHSQVSSNKFYKWLQTLKGEYKVLFKFKDGRELIEYDSISFASMDEHKFRTHIKEQLPYIYENVIGAFYENEIKNDIIDTIEQEFEKVLTKLYAV